MPQCGATDFMSNPIQVQFAIFVVVVPLSQAFSIEFDICRFSLTSISVDRYLSYDVSSLM